jgi:DNA-directed RNA polymerase
MESDVIAFLTLKKLIDATCNRAKMTKTAIELANMLEGEINAAQLEEDSPEFYKRALRNLPTSERIARRAEKLKTIKTRFKNDEYDLSPITNSPVRITDWAQRNKTIIGTLLLSEAVAITGFAEIRKIREGIKEYRILTPTIFFCNWLNENKERTAILSPFYWPCIVPPKEYSTVDDGGYYTLSTHKAKQFVKTHDKAFLNVLRETDLSQVYKTINIAQNTAWRINKAVLEVLKTMWDSDITLGVIPFHDKAKKPHCPCCGLEVGKEHPCFVTDKRVFRDWLYKMDRFHHEKTSVASRRLRVMRTLWIAETYEKYSAIYFPYQIDYRGRLYATPDFLNPQSDDLSKGLLEFTEGKPIETVEAKQWLMVHIANTFGFDKVSYQERVQWVEKNHEDIIACAQEPLNGGLWIEADSPWCFLAACIEYKGYCESKEVFISHIAIAQDGTCSGLQHYSAMLRDPVGGSAVNLIPADRPQDIYAVVAEKTREKLENITPDDSNYSFAQTWLESGLLNRKLTKRSVMTLPYGATAYSSKDFIMEYIKEVREKTPKKIPWQDTDIFPAVNFIGGIVWKAIQETVIAAGEAMKWLKELGAYAIGHNCPLTWTTPTGLIVRQTYMNTEERRVKTHLYGDAMKAFLGGEEKEPVQATTKEGIQVRLNFREPTDTLDKRKNVSAFAPNFVHSLDASALVLAVNSAHSEHGVNSFALIHDSFGTHAADSPTLAKVLREGFVAMYENNDVLQQLYEEVIGYVGDLYPDCPPPPPTKGSLNLRSVLDSPYFFA